MKKAKDGFDTDGVLFSYKKEVAVTVVPTTYA